MLNLIECFYTLISVWLMIPLFHLELFTKIVSFPSPSADHDELISCNFNPRPPITDILMDDVLDHFLNYFMDWLIDLLDDQFVFYSYSDLVMQTSSRGSE